MLWFSRPKTKNSNGYITKMFNVYKAEHNRIRGMPQCLELFCVNCVINRDVIPREACVKQYKLALMDIKWRKVKALRRKKNKNRVKIWNVRGENVKGKGGERGVQNWGRSGKMDKVKETMIIIKEEFLGRAKTRRTSNTKPRWQEDEILEILKRKKGVFEKWKSNRNEELTFKRVNREAKRKCGLSRRRRN